MSKRTKTTFKKSMDSLCNQLRSAVFHNHYTMVIHYMLEVDRQNNGQQTHAQIDIDEKYMRFNVYIYKPVFDEYLAQMDDGVMHTITHEFCHLICNPTYDLVKDHLSSDLVDVLHTYFERETETIRLILETTDYAQLKRYIK